MATIKELRSAVRVSQLAVARRARINRTRLSCAETGDLALAPAEERVIREVIGELARERFNHFLERLHETH
jgi:hypothetical protein